MLAHCPIESHKFNLQFMYSLEPWNFVFSRLVSLDFFCSFSICFDFLFRFVRFYSSVTVFSFKRACVYFFFFRCILHLCNIFKSVKFHLNDTSTAYGIYLARLSFQVCTCIIFSLCFFFHFLQQFFSHLFRFYCFLFQFSMRCSMVLSFWLSCPICGRCCQMHQCKMNELAWRSY